MLDGARVLRPGVYYRQPLSALVGSLREAGLELRDLREPAPGVSEATNEKTQDDGRLPRSVCLGAELTD
ncbi:hypothetical protein BRC92_11925 [Halobacteriales archaeon QS_4_69_31]|nr:MAG: hypothetical protein BRC92_11925 [Halobacteriales archaeon QS_4_69_31]